MNVVIPKGCLPWQQYEKGRDALDFILPNGDGYRVMLDDNTNEINLIKTYQLGAFKYLKTFDNVQMADAYVREQISPIVEKNYKEWSAVLCLLIVQPSQEDHPVQ